MRQDIVPLSTSANSSDKKIQAPLPLPFDSRGNKATTVKDASSRNLKTYILIVYYVILNNRRILGIRSLEGHVSGVFFLAFLAKNCIYLVFGVKELFGIYNRFHNGA